MWISWEAALMRELRVSLDVGNLWITLRVAGLGCGSAFRAILAHLSRSLWC
jgi:hypothetical protein